jgi:hypothetical protein
MMAIKAFCAKIGIEIVEEDGIVSRNGKFDMTEMAGAVEVIL